MEALTHLILLHTHILCFFSVFHGLSPTLHSALSRTLICSISQGLPSCLPSYGQ
jgi:hypothetical protein